MDTVLLVLLCVCILFSLYWRKKAEEYRELAKVFKLEYDNISRENVILKRQLERLENK
nr:MAG TPA: Cbb3-type cytochrome c oxidase subunit [Caudoviricetes sp.]